ncbi:MAG TPA: hypothetical protein VJT73_03855 [Polyangiaceae bacterium]|nr:hypothetical protein [Polyangiaceae bacterium]
MDRRPSKSLLVPALVAALGSVVGSATAAPKDAAATKLDQDAINNEYLGMQFPAAEKKLKQALALCGASNCSPALVAKIRMHLGVVYVVWTKADEAKTQFAEALKIDSALGVPKDLSTPEIEQVFAAAKNGTPVPAPATPEGPSAVGAEDIKHAPPAQQAFQTPVPIFAELPETMTPAKVQIQYKPVGASDWKALDMKRLKTGYGVEIPCADVGETPGDLKYFIQALSSGSEVVGTSGTRNAPHKVTIKSAVAGDAPHLPDKAPPARCGAASTSSVDCPPDLPGCPSVEKRGDKGPGVACEADGECQSGSCKNATCTAEEAAPPKECKSNGDCDAGQACNEGQCGSSVRKNWLGLGLQQDALLLDSTKGICVDASAYSCFRSDGSFYRPPASGVTGAGEVAGGFGLATTRVMVVYDRLFTDNITLGARVGYAFNGSPTKPGGSAFFPAHIEARGSYWIGKNPFGKAGIRPYVTVGGGASQVDAEVHDVAVHDPTAGKIPVAAWRKAGTVFGAVGGGVMYAFAKNSGIIAEVRVQQLFGSSATGVALQIGYVTGL